MRLLTAVAAAILALQPAVLAAALPVGATAPNFSAPGALAGRPFTFELSEQLRRGPVVLYFFPRAFTEGCTMEARAFSEAVGEFRELGARVIGMSADSYDTLRRFSVEECRNAFPVATASASTVNGYDVRLREGAPMTNRTSYVIAPDGEIIHVHSDMDWREHVPSALAALRAWRSRQAR
jgi:peroxiredoxin